jgi:hypothetical protein
MPLERIGEFLPIVGGKSPAAKQHGFMATDRMGFTQEVVDDFMTWNFDQVGGRDFHGG